MKSKQKKKYESVKIHTETVDKVRIHTDETEQSIGGFFKIAAEEKLKKFLETTAPPTTIQKQ